MSAENKPDSRKQHIYAMRELTRREIKRKYARSYLGIAWSILSPLLNMIVVTFVFSYMFSRNIENYPAYYFMGHILVAFFSTATITSMTSLRDNKSLMLRTKLPRRTFVLSRNYTALVNLGFSFIAFVFVMIFLKIKVTWTLVILPLDIFCLLIFAIGVSYMLSIWFVFYQDIKNIYSIVMMVLTRFAALFYSVDVLAPDVARIISFNPLYTYVKIARDCVLYGKISEPQYWIQMFAWSMGIFLLGRLIFDYNENRVVEKL